MSHANDFAAITRCTTPRAAKIHTCGACSEMIAVGTRYKRWFIASDGCGETVKQCIRCYEIWSAICDASPNEPITFELDCDESWGDVFGECPPEVEALAFAIPSDFEESSE